MQKEYDVTEAVLIKVVNDRCSQRRRGRRTGLYSPEGYREQKIRLEEQRARPDDRKKKEMKKNKDT